MLSVVFATLFLLCSAGGAAGQVNDTCPGGCDCLPDEYVPGGVKVECFSLLQVPDYWPEGTTSVDIELIGYPGIPSGTFDSMENMCQMYIEGEVGNIDTGAFANLRGNGCNHTALPLSRNRLLFLGADIRTIADGAFSNIRDFQYMQFLSYQNRGDIDRINKNAFKTVENIQQFTFEYIQVGYVDDEAFVGFRNIEFFVFEAATILSYNLASVGPFSDFTDVVTMKFDQMKSAVGREWEHGFTSFFFTGLGSGVSHIVFQNFDVTYIEPNAFSGLRNVKSILFDGVDVENITEGAFANVDGVDDFTFKGFNTYVEKTIVLQPRSFSGLGNVKTMSFNYMKVDLASQTFAGMHNLGAVRFFESEIAEGDIGAFNGMYAEKLAFECVVLPNEEQSHWRFGEADYIGHLSYNYSSTCDILGEAWIEFGAFIRTHIEKITFHNTTIRHLDYMAFAEVNNLEELSFTDCNIDRSEPNAFYNFVNTGRIVFRRVKWEIFAPQTFTFFENMELFEFDDVNLGTNRGIFPSDSFVDFDNIRHVRFNKLSALTFSTRAFGWDGTSSNINKFEITNSDFATLQSFAFHGLSNVADFHLEGNTVTCMETGAFMNMINVNTTLRGNELACEPIYDVPWHMDWQDRLHCLADQDKQCLVVTDPSSTPGPSSTQGTPLPTEPPGAAAGTAASLALLTLTLAAGLLL